jgi:hypothetical protein
MDELNAPTAKSPLSVGGILLIAIGAFLLLVPGGCALVGVASTLMFMTSRAANGAPAGLTVVALAISGLLALLAALGFWLVRAGWRRRRAQE